MIPTLRIPSRLSLAIFLSSTFYLSSQAVLPGEIRWHNEASDTTRVTEILIDATQTGKADGALVTALAAKFEGTPYGAGTLEFTPEMLTVNLDSLDCTTFVEDIMALAMTVQEGRSSWRDFAYNLEKIRYRHGNVNGYSSRLHYVSEWAVDNIHRGNFQEVTARVSPSVDYQVKTLDFMSANRDKYPVLKDDKEFENLKNVEIGYRSHRYPYIKTQNISRAELCEGDIVAVTSKLPGLDVSHMGIVTIGNDGKPHLMHASSKEGKVIVDPTPLADYMRKNRGANGIRVFRLGER